MNKILSSKLFTIFLVLLIILLGFSVARIYNLRLNMERENEGLQAKTEEMKKNNESLEKFLANLSNPSFLEKQAKIKLNYKLPGENVVFVYPEKSVDKAATPSESFKSELSKFDNLKKWLNSLLAGLGKLF